MITQAQNPESTLPGLDDPGKLAEAAEKQNKQPVAESASDSSLGELGVDGAVATVEVTASIVASIFDLFS